MADFVTDIDVYIPPDLKRIRWTREQADRAGSFIVYIFWGEARALYVGRSNRGLARPLCPSHDKARNARIEATTVEFICCNTEAESQMIEKRLIRKLQPSMNKAGLKEPVDPAVKFRQTIMRKYRAKKIADSQALDEALQQFNNIVPVKAWERA